MLSRFHPILERYWQTDGRTELLHQCRASVCWRAIKIIRFSWNFVHSSRFWTRWTSRDQKWKSCIGQTLSSTERISCCCYFRFRRPYYYFLLPVVVTVIWRQFLWARRGGKFGLCHSNYNNIYNFIRHTYFEFIFVISRHERKISPVSNKNLAIANRSRVSWLFLSTSVGKV